MRRTGLTLVALALLAACGSGSGAALDENALVIVVSSDLAVGRHRVAVGAVDQANESVVLPTASVTFEFFRPDGTPAGGTDAAFIWAIPDVRGLWVANFDFDIAGGWQLGVRDEDGILVVSPPFNVALETSAIDIGDPAPPSESKTLEDGALAEITTDPEPDPAFYEMTVAEAVGSGHPSVIVFATPAFCVSATCGPSLEVTKDLAADFPNVNFVHVEVFDNLDASTRDELVPAGPIIDWGLQTEPWIYVVDRAGIVQARFEGAVGADELRTAVDAVN
ncbi:MAG: hypothetical protein OEM97_05415 [Acidimicrobiia bacterium]|nr:hypothetical protein [Acidimicrobiia bacterium]